MTANKKVLYISWVVPPASGGSAYITHQIARLCNSEKIIFAGGCGRPFMGIREYEGIPYHYFFTELSLLGHGQRYFSIIRWLIFPIFIINLYRLAKKEKAELLCATFPDGYYLLAAHLLSLILNISLYTYFHNTYVENRNGVSKWFASKIQTSVFHRSKKIYLVSEGMLNYYVSAYPHLKNKFEVLPHTFERYPKINKSNLHSLLPFKCVMIGTFNNSNMEATIRLLSLIRNYKHKYQVDIYTSVNKQLLKYKWGLDSDSLGINYKGFVKQEDVNELLSSYDVCLITHGFTGEYTEIEYQTIFPTRMIPLLLSGRPILAHSPPNSFLNLFIKKYDCAELVSDTTDESLLAGLMRVTEDKERIQQLQVNAKKACEYFYGPAIVNHWLLQINESI